MSRNLRILAEYSRRMAAGDYDAVYETFAPDFVEHWGGPHCSQGIGLAGAVAASAGDGGG